jgi:putative transposase
MVNFRRSKVAGGTYFFTVNLRNRRTTTLTDNIDLLRGSFHETKLRHPFHIDAIVILSDHLHAIWTLPDRDTNYSTRWQLLKSLFTRKLRKQGINISRNSKGEYNVWQRRFWEHTIRDEPDLKRHIDYIHYNPVKHGWVEHVKDWPFSSFHRYVANGWLDVSWGTTYRETTIQNFGE